MLIHVTPRINLQYAPKDALPCTLYDVVIPELGLRLDGKQNLVARKPYPNKNYLVACRKVGRFAVSGILVEAQVRLPKFTVVTRWRTAYGLHTHEVAYEVLDGEFDAVSDNMLLWGGWQRDGSTWSNRYPESARAWSPVQAEPRMILAGRDERVLEVIERRDMYGVVFDRNETFPIPSLERERLLSQFPSSLRLPTIGDAFFADVMPKKAA
jgi:hypothetical protein